LPNGTDRSGYSQDQLDAIAEEINNRPSKTLNAYTPLEVYRNLLLNHHAAPATIHYPDLALKLEFKKYIQAKAAIKFI